MKKFKIVNKKRFLTFLLAVLSIIMFLGSMQFKDNKVYSSKHFEEHNKIFVKEGDTIWEIAINNMPKKYDVRQMVYEIKKLNQIVDSKIYPGEEIKIPSTN